MFFADIRVDRLTSVEDSDGNRWCERCVSDALSVGYRLIDTAQAYQNEEGVGNAWRKSGIKREDLFLVTKVWISNAGEEQAAKSIDESLRKLQTEYIDLLLIHQAYSDVFGTWRAMELLPFHHPHFLADALS